MKALTDGLHGESLFLSACDTYSWANIVIYSQVGFVRVADNSFRMAQSMGSRNAGNKLGNNWKLYNWIIFAAGVQQQGPKKRECIQVDFSENVCMELLY